MNETMKHIFHVFFSHHIGGEKQEINIGATTVDSNKFYCLKKLRRFEKVTH
ncbi:hypothetical protein JOC94_003242 [Bacillus thermophilus]|uniref:Uncharacterized protein n=1 Tax=Siminovitchia thermophila TaxID=1245522 RepID=A0ABS2R9A9_9BACI|nr:hypothetical protein [Siminovitchia thermophila]